MINKKLFNISQPKEIEIDGLFKDSNLKYLLLIKMKLKYYLIMFLH